MIARMRFLHTMLRVRDLDAALDFFVAKLGLRELRRTDHASGRFTLVFLGTGDPGDDAQIELTHNWDQATHYPTGRFFGHLAFAVDDIHATCARAWTREPSQCFGPWARMNDGTLCALQSAFTGAPRSVLACRRCQTTLFGFEPVP